MFGATPLCIIQISLHPLHGNGSRKNQVHLQVRSTTPCRTNCHDFPNAATHMPASHPANALLEGKLVFIRVGAKGNVYTPRADEHMCVL